MNNFVDTLRDHHLRLEEIDLLDAIMRDCGVRAGLITANVRNLEVLASYVSMLKFSYPNHIFTGDDTSATPAEAEEFLSDAITRVTGTKFGTDRVSNSRSLLNFLSSNEVRSTIITTNYDMHFELAACRPTDKSRKNAGLRISDHGCLSVQSEKVEDRFGNATIYATEDSSRPLLLKLHGSVNWLKTSSGIIADGNLYSVPLDAKDTNDPQMGYTTDNNRNIRERRLIWSIRDEYKLTNPLLMLPTVLKPEHDEFLKLQWQHAAAALKSADQVWFIGYSFPDSDSYMRYFLSTCLAENTKIRQVAIIDPDRSVFYERAAKVFSDARLREISKMYPHSWVGTQWEEVFRSNPFHRLRDEGSIRQAELEVRQQRAHEGEYQHFENAAENSTWQNRGRGRGRLR